MIEDPNSESPSNGYTDNLQNKADTPDKLRNPRATRKGPDMPGDFRKHRTDPDNDYEKPDGSERERR